MPSTRPRIWWNENSATRVKQRQSDVAHLYRLRDWMDNAVALGKAEATPEDQRSPKLVVNAAQESWAKGEKAYHSMRLWSKHSKMDFIRNLWEEQYIIGRLSEQVILENASVSMFLAWEGYPLKFLGV
jgi:hypothetical protein